MNKLINGTEIANQILDTTAKKVSALRAKGHKPTLAVILVGDNQASHSYVRRKQLAAEKIGVTFVLVNLPSTVSKKIIVAKIKRLQKNKHLSGLIVQLPLPEPLYTTEVLNAIDPRVDVDCLTDVNLGKLVMKTQKILPPTPGAVMSILANLKIDLTGKSVTIVGVGALVGKPLAIMLMNARASVTTVNSATKNFAKKCREADILVTGVGKKDLIRGTMVKRGAIVIDTGVDFENGKMFGDVNVDEVGKKAKYLTPTPGGVGPITVARLLANTVECAEINSLPVNKPGKK